VSAQGSVTCIYLKSGSNSKAQVKTASFKDVSIPAGVRIFPDNKGTPERDIEPEYITVSADSKTAWVSLQEANAIAKLHIPSCRCVCFRTLAVNWHVY
jgi:hypothetical protein